jgi:uncharacterized protein
MRQMIDVGVLMRDGVRLSTDVRLPDEAGRFPVIVWRTPYSNSDVGTRYVGMGYVLVTQDCRGRFDSDGEFRAFDEGADGEDLIAWVMKQAWCDGRVGMIGGSYAATTQLNCAWRRPEGLKAITPRVMGRDLFIDTVYRNGVFCLELAASWGMMMAGRANQNTTQVDWGQALKNLPVVSIPEAAGYRVPFFKECLAHETYDAHWHERSVEAHYDSLDVPMLHINGWYDIYSEGMLRNYEGLVKRHGAGRQKIVVGPWVHSLNWRVVGQMDFGPQAVVDLDAMEARWLARWLKGEMNGVENEAPVRIFVMGINQWRDEAAWPLARANQESFFLGSGGRANSLFGDGVLSAEPREGAGMDTYVYDPENPVPTVGSGTFGAATSAFAGPTDHAPIERRDDVLVYSSPVLEAPMEVTGYINAELYVSTDAVDTDFVVRLCDVYPDGRSMVLCDGVARLSFREGLQKKVLATPGEVYRLELCIGVTSNVFLPGHRVRVEVTSSCFPRFVRHLNTGEATGTGTRLVVARSTVHHSRGRQSRVILPVVE